MEETVRCLDRRALVLSRVRHDRPVRRPYPPILKFVDTKTARELTAVMSGRAAGVGGKRGREDEEALDEALDKLRPTPAPAATWYWEEELHRMSQHDRARTLKPNWVAYAADKAAELERAFREFQEQGTAHERHRTTVAGKAITVRFGQMEQVNDATGWRRKIKRVGARVEEVVLVSDDDASKGEGAVAEGGRATKKHTGGATLKRRHSSGSMGAPNTAASGGRANVQVPPSVCVRLPPPVGIDSDMRGVPSVAQHSFAGRIDCRHDCAGQKLVGTLPSLSRFTRARLACIAFLSAAAQLSSRARVWAAPQQKARAQGDDHV